MRQSNGIIGNHDVAPLYDFRYHPDVAARVNTHRALHAQFKKEKRIFTAERVLPGRMLPDGTRGPRRIQKVVVEAVSFNDALPLLVELASGHFLPSRALWRIGNQSFRT